jgi:prevent-host-death family protein
MPVQCRYTDRMAKTYSLTELRASLGAVIKQAIAHPEDDYMIADNGHPIAVIVPIDELRRMRSIVEAAEAGLTIVTDPDGRPNIELDDMAVAYLKARWQADATRAKTA